MRRVGALAAVLVFAGCGGGPAAPGDTSHLTDTPLAPLAQPAPQPPDGRRLRFRATDGVRLHGTLYPAAQPHAPAVVLVHGLAGNPHQWDGFVHDLHRAGFAALAYASRSDQETDPAVLARDVAGAVNALRTVRAVDPERIALGGASVGGSAVADALSTDLPVVGGVAVSAVAGRSFRPHDLLLISDVREAATARRLRAAAHDSGVTVAIAPTVGHGTVLLRDADVRARAIAWLRTLVTR